MNFLAQKIVAIVVLSVHFSISAAVADRVSHNFFHEESSLVVSFYQDLNSTNVIANRQLVLSVKKYDLVPYTRDAVRCRNSEADCWTLDFENKRRDKKTLGEVLALKYGSSVANLKLQATLQAAREILSMEEAEKRITGSTRIFFESMNRVTQPNEAGSPMPGKSYSFLIADDCSTHFMLREIFDADGLWNNRNRVSFESLSTRLLQSQDVSKNARYKTLIRIVTQVLKDYIESEFPEKLR